MTNRVNVKESPTAGKGLFAKEKIEPGQVIATIPRALIVVLDAAHLEDACSNCFVWTKRPPTEGGEGDGRKLEVKACTGCQVVRYCSKKCQRESWKRNHKFECKTLAIGKEVRLSQWPNAVRCVIQILTMRSGGAISEEQWEALLKLKSHMKKKKEAGGPTWASVQLMGEGAWRYTQDAYPNTFDAALGRSLFAKVLTNSMALVTPTFEPLGVCLDPQAALANHSCDPNALVVMDGSELSLRSIKPIKNDEEVLISYVDCTEPLSRRQYELKEKYHFKCACTKCSKGHNTKEDEWKQPLNKLIQKWKETADIRGKRDPELFDLANYLGDDIHSKRMQVVQTLAYNVLEDAREMDNPKKAISKLEDGIRLCFQTEMWPIHRQPYPTFRHELMLRMLDVGNFIIASHQGAKSYWLIDPILYPYEHHPVRVVRKWTLAMLFLYLASEPDDTGTIADMRRQSINLAVIGFGLIHEVLESIPFSHGTTGSFAKMAQKKASEVASEMTGGNAQRFEQLQDEVKIQWEYFRQMAGWMMM